MDMSGNSSNEASDSDDYFDESNRRYEYIMLRAGQHGTKAVVQTVGNTGLTLNAEVSFLEISPTVSFLMMPSL